MATTERARITGFFVIGFLVGLVTMYFLVINQSIKIQSDTYIPDPRYEWDLSELITREPYTGGGDIVCDPYTDAVCEIINKDFRSDVESCLEEFGYRDVDGDGDIDRDDYPGNTQFELDQRSCGEEYAERYRDLFEALEEDLKKGRLPQEESI